MSQLNNSGVVETFTCAGSQEHVLIWRGTASRVESPTWCLDVRWHVKKCTFVLDDYVVLVATRPIT